MVLNTWAEPAWSCGRLADKRSSADKNLARLPRFLSVWMAPPSARCTEFSFLILEKSSVLGEEQTEYSPKITTQGK